MARISRQELKSDEFVSGMDTAYEFFLEHQTTIVVTAVVIAVVVLCGWGAWSWHNHRDQSAAALLGAGLDTLHAPLASSNPPAGVAAFPSVAARGQAAAGQFQTLADRYGSTPSGHLAQYYLGLAQEDAGEPQAEATLQKAASGSDATASALAKNALANYYQSRNENQPAIAELRQIAGLNSPLLPHSVVWMELANLERDTNPTDAANYYRLLQAEYPGTDTAQQAQQGLATLHVPPAPALGK